MANEKITLTLGSGTGQQVFRTRGLWQLLMTQPKECQQHLLPLLDVLRPNWNLADSAARVEERLLQEANGDGAASRARWADLVAQLGDENFAKREAADRALRTGNAGAVAYLRQLDVNHLDTEQQFRVSRILDAITVQNGDDSVEQVAATLATDPTVWLALLARPDPSARRTAVRELAEPAGPVHCGRSGRRSRQPKRQAGTVTGEDRREREVAGERQSPLSPAGPSLAAVQVAFAVV